MLDRKRFKFYYQLAIDVATGIVSKADMREMFDKEADLRQFIKQFLEPVLAVKQAKPFIINIEKCLIDVNKMSAKMISVIIEGCDNAIKNLTEEYNWSKGNFKFIKDTFGKLTDEELIMEKQLDDMYQKSMEQWNNWKKNPIEAAKWMNDDTRNMLQKVNNIIQNKKDDDYKIVLLQLLNIL